MEKYLVGNHPSIVANNQTYTYNQELTLAPSEVNTLVQLGVSLRWVCCDDCPDDEVLQGAMND
jgi:hypothetical protein